MFAITILIKQFRASPTWHDTTRCKTLSKKDETRCSFSSLTLTKYTWQLKSAFSGDFHTADAYSPTLGKLRLELRLFFMTFSLSPPRWNLLNPTCKSSHSAGTFCKVTLTQFRRRCTNASNFSFSPVWRWLAIIWRVRENWQKKQKCNQRDENCLRLARLQPSFVHSSLIFFSLNFIYGDQFRWTIHWFRWWCFELSWVQVAVMNSKFNKKLQVESDEIFYLLSTWFRWTIFRTFHSTYTKKFLRSEEKRNYQSANILDKVR